MHFKCKNNDIKRKRFLGAGNLYGRHSKWEFHVLVNEMKLFDHEFFFKDIATQHFNFLTVMFDSNSVWFVFLISCIQQLHWLITLTVLNIFFQFEVQFFSTPKKKKQSSTRKKIIVFLVGALAQHCRKISEVDSALGPFTATKMCRLPQAATQGRFCLLQRKADICQKSIETNLNFLKLFSIYQNGHAN